MPVREKRITRWSQFSADIAVAHRSVITANTSEAVVPTRSPPIIHVDQRIQHLEKHHPLTKPFTHLYREDTASVSDGFQLGAQGIFRDDKVATIRVPQNSNGPFDIID